MNNKGVTGQFVPPKTDLSMHMFGSRYSALAILAYVFFVDKSQILIEQPSVGLASLTQLALIYHSKHGRRYDVEFLIAQ